MTEVLFDGKNLSEWLIISSVNIGVPEVKSNLVDVPGANGTLDMTEAFGTPVYKDRNIVIKAGKRYAKESWAAVRSEILNQFHGKKVKIQLSTEPGYYYLGRLIKAKETSECRIFYLEFTIQAEPYKYRTNKTVRSFSVSSTSNIILENLFFPVVPALTVTEEVTIEFEGNSFTVGSGTKLLPDLVLKAGRNQMTLSGSGTIRFEYQESGL